MKKRKKTIIAIIFSIIIATIYELILKYNFGKESRYLIDKIIIDSMIIFFIWLHYIYETKELYNFIINHRYKIAVIILIVFTLLQYSGSSNSLFAELVFEPEKSNTLFAFPRGIRSDEYALETMVAVSQKENNYEYTNDRLRGSSTDVFSVIHSPVKDIVSIGRLYNLGHVLLKNPSMGVAFSWNFKMLSLLLISYELCEIITNKNRKLSILGTILISFSGFIQWWSIVDIIIYGELAIVLLNKFLLSKKYVTRLMCLVGITISALSYIFTFYPPYMIAFGYVFLALAIWIFIKNSNQYKTCFKDIISVLVFVVFIFLMCLRYFTLSNETLKILQNTSYPGERLETGGNGIMYLFSYLYNFLLPYMEVGDNCALSSIISLFPIPIILSVICILRKKGDKAFLVPIAIITIFETIFCITGIPKIISEITLFKYVIVERAAIAVNFANMYLMIYLLENIKEKLISFKGTIYVSIILMCVASFVPLPTNINNIEFLSLGTGMLCMYSFLFLNYSDERYKKVLITFLIIFTLVGAYGVNPITKGIYAVTETDFAKAVKQIVNEDKEANWISLNDIMPLANYLVANGAKTINSTNIYPNKEFFETVLGKEGAEESKNIWNRYSHITMELSEKCFVELIEKDKIKVYITPEKLKELEIKYIVSYKEEKEIEKNGANIETLYEKKSDKKLEINGEKVNKISIYKLIND